VAYETRIYRDILAKVTTRVVPYLGHYEEPGSEAVWLFLEFLGDAPTIHLTTTPFENLIRAARWIGDFHAQTEALLEDAQPGFLNEYDRTYFTGWARRTTEYAGRWHSRHKWLQQACERFEEVSELLLEPAQCIIHGEYYPKNILISNDVICPVDWESAAIAAGEIDLASLTDRWPDEIERRCELAYCDARWNGCAPDQAFRDRLSAARIYLHLRWLGTNVETTTDKERGHRLEQLKRDALQTGLIQ
jgi:aminoglycoside/choline kinase family phosphotransferase